MANDKIPIRTSKVLEMLKEGKTREDIRNHYGLSKTELKDLFQHEKLKGRKTHKAPSFVIVDDIEEEGDTRASTGSTTSSPGAAGQRDSLFASRNENVDVDDV